MRQFRLGQAVERGHLWWHKTGRICALAGGGPLGVAIGDAETETWPVKGTRLAPHFCQLPDTYGYTLGAIRVCPERVCQRRWELVHLQELTTIDNASQIDIGPDVWIDTNA